MPDILARTDGHAALTERFAHAVDMIRQAIAPQMLLTDEQQIDAVFLASLRMDLAFSMSEGNTGAVMPKRSKMASVSSIRLSASERGMNWVRSVLPSLWMKLSLPSENSPPPPSPKGYGRGRTSCISWPCRADSRAS